MLFCMSVNTIYKNLEIFFCMAAVKKGYEMSVVKDDSYR